MVCCSGLAAAACLAACGVREVFGLQQYCSHSSSRPTKLVATSLYITHRDSKCGCTAVTQLF
jgi:hypothetical protein